MPRPGCASQSAGPVLKGAADKRRTAEGRKNSLFAGHKKSAPLILGALFVFFSIKLNKNNTRPEKGNKGFSYYQEV